MNTSRKKEGPPGKARAEFARAASPRSPRRAPVAMPQYADHDIGAADLTYRDEPGQHLWAAPPAYDRAG